MKKLIAIGLATAFAALPLLASASSYYPSFTINTNSYNSSASSALQQLMQMQQQRGAYTAPQPATYQPAYSYTQPAYSYSQPTYSQPTTYGYQSQQQQQSSYTPAYSYQQPTYSTSSQQPTYDQYSGSTYNSATYGYTPPQPYVSYTTTPYTDAFGDPLCKYADYPVNSVCGTDPQQPVFDPYTETWY